MTGHFDKSFGNWLPDDEKYYCDICEESFPEDDMVEIHGQTVCQNCLDLYFTECEKCNDLVLEDELVEATDGKRVCQSCYDENFSS